MCFECLSSPCLRVRFENLPWMEEWREHRQRTVRKPGNVIQEHAKHRKWDKTFLCELLTWLAYLPVVFCVKLIPKQERNQKFRNRLVCLNSPFWRTNLHDPVQKGKIHPCRVKCSFNLVKCVCFIRSTPGPTNGPFLSIFNGGVLGTWAFAVGVALPPWVHLEPHAVPKLACLLFWKKMLVPGLSSDQGLNLHHWNFESIAIMHTLSSFRQIKKMSFARVQSQLLPQLLSCSAAQKKMHN